MKHIAQEQIKQKQEYQPHINQKYTEEKLSKEKVSLRWFQSNDEREIIETIQGATKLDYDALIINPAAFSHTSVAILDALKMLEIPVIEVHLSNTHLREEFRQVKLTAKASTIIMEGLGKRAYLMAVYSQIIN